ncbi:hypothetical protein LPTSP4_29860 [Leptospira ryugenii]|uniref:Uncharacterized protein n=1 Tax=Leptospira ryugenii TaxID=1917863 RepID=A0A2P2E3L4_9LEPT|nr:hypothetical protein [Leptospira ryugenii]GBF51449.1 hypothetical protein LPTSP4_29860 [Leptospira ryugenii]
MKGLQKNHPMKFFFSNLIVKFASIFLVFMILPECSTFGPRNNQSSLIILQMTLQKDELLLDELIDPRFQKVTLRKGDSTYEFSENSGDYYYFQNLKEGQYEVYDAVHLLNRGASDFPYGSTKQTPKIDIDFDKKDIEATRLELKPGTVVFMGTFHVKVNFKYNAEPEIKMVFSKNLEDEEAAYDYLYKNYPKNGWGQKAKTRAKFLQSIGK